MHEHHVEQVHTLTNMFNCRIAKMEYKFHLKAKRPTLM